MPAIQHDVLLEKCEDVSQTLKSLSHPIRLKILCYLLGRERTVGELTQFCKISQSAMSQFLDRMKRDGLVLSRRESTRIYYRFANADVLKLLKSIQNIYC